MNIAIVSPYSRRSIEKSARAAGFTLTKTKPDLVITYGGDGTILRAEHDYPDVPKLAIQKSMVCSKCRAYTIEDVPRLLRAVNENRFRIVEEQKVEARIGRKKIVALNEIQLRNINPRRAVRMDMHVDGKTTRNIIGDGLVAATPYGSTAYYRALGYAPFASGVRVGFNNVWPRKAPIVVKDRCTIKLVREDALLAADNFFAKTIRPGARITIRPAREKARFIVVR